MNTRRVTPLEIRVQKLDRLFYAFAEHEPAVVFRGRSVFDAVGQVICRYRDVIAVHGLGDVVWFREDGRMMNAVPLPACDWKTERFRREFRPGERRAA